MLDDDHDLVAPNEPGLPRRVVLGDDRLANRDEALLAVGFIFTMHFFNGHLRPEKFPMDPVIFTGRVSMEEFRDERPAEYERLVREGRLDSIRTNPPEPWLWKLGRVIGTIAVTTGLVLVGFILYALLT